MRMLIIIILSLCLFSCESEDKKIFKKAESFYNTGMIDSSVFYHRKLIAKYPDNKWRQISDAQIEKGEKILHLLRLAKAKEMNGDFDGTLLLHEEIKAINPIVFENNRNTINNILLKRYLASIYIFLASIKKEIAIINAYLGLADALEGFDSRNFFMMDQVEKTREYIRKSRKKTTDAYSQIKEIPFDSLLIISSTMQTIYFAFQGLSEKFKDQNYSASELQYETNKFRDFATNESIQTRKLIKEYLGITVDFSE